MSTVQIRQATENDLPGIARVRVDTWRVAYRGILLEEFLENLSYESIVERWRDTLWRNRKAGVQVYVAESGSKDIIGFAICGPAQGESPIGRGEILALYVLPNYQNQGVGHGLVTTCVKHLIHNLKLETMLIWVILENPYRRFYESLGGILLETKSREIGGQMVRLAGYGWADIHKLL